MITCWVLLEGPEEEFLCSFIYASNFIEDRKELWEDIKSHQDSPIFRDKPWILCGDFNEILDVQEHSSFTDSPMVLSGMRVFQGLVQYCSLFDLVQHGPKFTWCNKRSEGLICKKLDRVLTNSCWLQSYPHHIVYLNLEVVRTILGVESTWLATIRGEENHLNSQMFLLLSHSSQIWSITIGETQILFMFLPQPYTDSRRN